MPSYEYGMDEATHVYQINKEEKDGDVIFTFSIRPDLYEAQ